MAQVSGYGSVRDSVSGGGQATVSRGNDPLRPPTGPVRRRGRRSRKEALMRIVLTRGVAPADVERDA
jgi:hypothetical protein